MPTSTSTERVVRRIATRYHEARRSGRADPAPFAIRVDDGPAHLIGEREPAVTLVVRGRRGLDALHGLDLVEIGQAYLHGDLDIDGDVSRALSLRDLFTDFHPLRRAWHYVRPRLVGQVSNDKHVIAHHYDHDDEFYLLFLDAAHRCYSHGIFERDDEPLETAIARKLGFAVAQTGLRPGMRVLDIGTGWGAFLEYGGRHGLDVTSLTISKQSSRFANALLARERLPGRVLLEHLYEHRPGRPYDAIVNLGVTEHLPDYATTLAHYGRLLKPGGFVYLDASAARTRSDLSTFLLQHLFPGNGTPMVLHEYLAAVAASPFALRAVYDDRHNYFLTVRRWLAGLERNAAEIERRWGRTLFRSFQLYLAGCADGFARDTIQAYRVVLQLAPQA
jgi:cyclopropane-fatty-acyl-phospholipid synthase